MAVTDNQELTEPVRLQIVEGVVQRALLPPLRDAMNSLAQHGFLKIDDYYITVTQTVLRLSRLVADEYLGCVKNADKNALKAACEAELMALIEEIG